MKKLTLLLSVVLLTLTATARHNYYEKKAHKYMKKLGLQEQEMYYADLKELASRYKSEGETSVTFPNNHVFNSQNEEVMVLYKNGDTASILSCLGAFADDLGRYMLDTGGMNYITIDNTLEAEFEILKPVFAQKRKDSDKEKVVIYYPAGMPLVKKSYKTLTDEIQRYRQEGKDIDVYFVMVRVFDKNAYKS